ncbi:MAG: DUF2961 domain-containing protein, partial [Verrucomicrobia bacterium]|nr:DUF2961 domain-containing protein [Verrucomicrobiota bacterium]
MTTKFQQNLRVNLAHPYAWKQDESTGGRSPALAGTLSPFKGEREKESGLTSIPQPPLIRVGGAGGVSHLFTLVLLSANLHAGAATVADLGADYLTGSPKAGWQYLQSTAATGGTETALTYGSAVGSQGNLGYGGGGNGFNLPCVLGAASTGNFILFSDGANNGVLGTDLLVHPGDAVNLPPTTTQTYVIMRYTISTADVTNGPQAAIVGSFRRSLMSSDGVIAYVFKNATQLWTVSSSDRLSQVDGAFSLTTTLAAGDTISFVLGNHGNLYGDESAVRGTITLAMAPPPPSIVSGPTVSPSSSVFTGGSFNLSVTAGGAPPLSYQWRHAGTNVVSATNNPVTFSKVTTNDSGNYDIVISNAGGSITSSVISVTVGSAVRVSDLAADYQVTTPRTGWRYLKSTAASGGTETALTYGTGVGNEGNIGYGGGGNGYNLPCVLGAASTGNFILFNDGANNGVIGTDLLVHPGDAANLPPTTTQTFVIMRYTISAADVANGPQATILGSFRRGLTTGDGVAVHVLRNTTQLWSGSSTAQLTQAAGTFYLITTVAAGDTISFVLGNNSNLIADESAVRGSIGLSGPQPPIITSPLTATPGSTIFIGDSFALNASVAGIGPLNFTWRLNGGIVTNSGANSTVAFTSAQTNQTGSYDVVVANSYGSVTSAPVTITVVAPGTYATTFGQMLTEMVDRDQLAKDPQSAFVSRLVSSTDPRDPGTSPTGQPAGHMNSDWSNFRRWELNGGRREWVLIDVPGPGVLTRWWSGGFPEVANCRIYLDNSVTPIFTGNPSLTELVTGQFANLFGWALAFEAARGIDSYAPIPFQQRLKITWDGSNPHGTGGADGSPPPPLGDATGGLWFNIEYRQYTNGTEIKTYSASDPIQDRLVLELASNRLAAPAVAGNVSQSTTNIGSLAPGESFVRTLMGSAAIRRIFVKVTGADQAAAVAANGDLTSLWVMPFKNTAEVRLVNQSSQTITVTLEVAVGTWTWNDQSMYYHAQFQQEDGIKSDGGNVGGGQAMWNFVNLRGRGVYVADTLSVNNNTGSWWGEGDEKIYVDEDVYPSFSGTGSEDYYGFAWGNGALFQKRFVSQPNSSGNGSSGVSVESRLRLLDTIPFTNRLRFDMEFSTGGTGSAGYQAVSHWYGLPGAVSLRTAADLGVDFRTGSSAQTSQEVGVLDTIGTGSWNYYSSSHANPSAPGARMILLKWGSVGNAGHTAFGGGQA